MPTSAEATIRTSNGIFLIRDARADTHADQSAAAHASRIPGHRGGRLLGAAGTVIQIRCAHQYSKPHVRIEILDEAPTANEQPWHWEEPTHITVTSGRIGIEEEYETSLELDATPGPYTVLVGHLGRREIQDAATTIEQDTLSTGADTYTAWQALSGTEKYRIRIYRIPSQPFKQSD